MLCSTALRLLRTNPKKAFTICSFFVDYPFKIGQPEPDPHVGGKQTFSINKLKSIDKDMFCLEVNQKGNDCYYFPYCNSQAYPTVGFCFVPVDESPGTLVLTGGMNGCALQINYTADRQCLIFIHDLNSKSITKESRDSIVSLINMAYKSTPEFVRSQQDAIDPKDPDSLFNCALRVDANLYIDIDEDAKVHGRQTNAFAYSLITVKSLSTWDVYSSCVVQFEDLIYAKPDRHVGPPYLIGSVKS